MTNPEKNMLKAVLRTDFASFIGKVFSTINQGIKYEHNWHIDLIADYLTAVHNGEIKGLIINVPPRSLKSVCVSVAWPAFLLGQDPTKRIIAASYAQSLSIKHSLDCRLVMNSHWYQELFPTLRLSTSHNQKSKFLTTENGFRMATSIGGMVTGEGGDVLIIDDPHNPSHIHSEKRRKSVIEWYEQSFSTRLNNKKTGSIVLVMQRLYTEDLAGYLLHNSPNFWTKLEVPVVSAAKTIYQIGNKKYVQEEGDIFHIARYSEDNLSKIKDEMGMSNFAAQYMQQPLEQNTGMLDIKDIAFYEVMENPFDYIMQSWDTAIKTGEASDYSVCTTWAIKENNYYLLHMQRGKFAYPELKNEAIKLKARFNPRIILIEDYASGQSLLQDLRAEGITNLLGIKHKMDKITRFASIVGLFQSGIVKIPKKAVWLKVFLSEITEFPHASHDDIVDSVSQFLGYMKKNSHMEKRIRVRSF